MIFDFYDILEDVQFCYDTEQDSALIKDAKLPKKLHQAISDWWDEAAPDYVAKRKREQDEADADAAYDRLRVDGF